VLSKLEDLFNICKSVVFAVVVQHFWQNQ